ncbi:MAG: NYN domain-containing protein [Anaerolineae bacterium]|nr:NYN domain-containing protein [Anaerolineae bacterium]
MEETSENIKNKRLAMLIDGDNAQPSLIKDILAETGKYGLITIRRIYGDWTTANMGGWKDVLQEHAVQPIQQFRYTTGKNATDSAMIIDAMDILYEGIVDGFCLVSSDSDYTRLAMRIREKGFFVMGIGKKTTPRAFVNACEVFVFTENLVAVSEPTRTKVQGSKKTAEAAKPSMAPAELLPLLRRAFEAAMQDNGWASLGVLGSHLRQLDPSFDPRTYGYRQLSMLIQAYPDVFLFKEVKRKDGNSIISVKLKE